MALLKTQFDYWREQSINNVTTLNKKIEILENKVNKATKNLSSWDFYKISDVVLQPSEFDAKWANLLPNTGLIINSDTFNVGENKLSRGDIVFKHDDLSATYIDAENGGILYPSTISKNNTDGTYSLTYNFSGQSPNPGSSNSVELGNTSGLADTITFTKLSSITPSSIYGRVETPKENLVSFKVEEDIFPMIKFYASNNEEIYYDYSIKEEGGQYKIQNIPNIISTVVVK